jgi:hypothetical protein
MHTDFKETETVEGQTCAQRNTIHTGTHRYVRVHVYVYVFVYEVFQRFVTMDHYHYTIIFFGFYS